MATTKKTRRRTRCPICRGKIQATQVTEVYYTYIKGTGWYREPKLGQGLGEVRFYCENDHQLSRDQVPEFA